MYFSNSASHAACESGGMTPVIGFHSVIDRPDSVSRTAPPTITIRKTSAATLHSQRRTERAPSRAAERGAGNAVDEGETVRHGQGSLRVAERRQT